MMTLPKLEWYGDSDIGLSRKNNEDVWASFPQKGLFAIADGMGGHLAGEIAAREAAANVCNHALTLFNQISLSDLTQENIQKWIYQSFIETNSYIYNLAQKNKALKGMGSTLSFLYLHTTKAYLGHVGDSRIYHVHDKKMKLITNDHCLIKKTNEKKCKIYRHIITKAIGIRSAIVPEIFSITFQPQDLFLLCRDGLSDFVPHEEIQKTICNETLSLKEKVKKLIDQAKKKGSRDNITALLLKVSS